MDIFINILNWIVQFFVLLYFCMVFAAGVLLQQYPHLFSADESLHRILRFLYRCTAPVFACIRKILPSTLANGYDLAPLFTLLILLVLTLLLSPFFIAWSSVASLPV